MNQVSDFEINYYESVLPDIIEYWGTSIELENTYQHYCNVIESNMNLYMFDEWQFLLMIAISKSNDGSSTFESLKKAILRELENDKKTLITNEGRPKAERSETAPSAICEYKNREMTLQKN